jgi:hypothetical protein
MKRQKEIIQALKIRFPHFNENQFQSAAQWISRAFYRELSESPNMGTSIVENIFQYFVDEAKKSGRNFEDLSFGYAIKGAKKWTKVANIFRGYDVCSFDERFDRLENFQCISLVIEGCIGQNSSADKRLEFIRLVEKEVNFTKTEASIWIIMKEISEDFINEGVFDFWSEVWFRVDRERVDIGKRYFDTLKSRIIEKIKNHSPRAIEALYYVPHQVELEKLLRALEQLDLIFSNKNILRQEKTAYQFSSHELTSMIKFAELMLNRMGGRENFGYHIDRFPKVYTAKLPTEIEKTLLGQDDNENINTEVEGKYTDAFGQYVYSIESINEFGVPFTEEGVIIIDVEKISRWAKFKELKSEDVRFVVLMHELGHWFSHWARCIPNNNNKINIQENVLRQWNPGFQLPNTMTKEAFANIFCYWACQATKDVHLRDRQLKVLDALTPKKNGVVNTSNPYGAYELLKPLSLPNLLFKLNILRANWMLKDQYQFDFLKSPQQNILEWLGSRKPEDVTTEDFNNTLIDKSVWDHGGSRILTRENVIPKRP